MVTISVTVVHSPPNGSFEPMRRKEALNVDLDIVDLSHDGRGVARHEGKVAFIEDALPGERVSARLHRRKRDFDEGTLLAVLAPSPERVEPRCQHFGVCAGCVLQHLDPMSQIAFKQKTLLENFRRIAGLVPDAVLPPLTAPVWGYRRKGRLSVKHVPKKERVLVGFRERNPRMVADIRRCEVLDPRVGHRIEAIADLIGSLDAGKDIAQVEIAAGDDLPALVFRHLQPLGEADHARLHAFGRAEGMAIYLQPGGVDSVYRLWPEQHELSFHLEGAGLRYRFAPLDFVQVNAAINEAMIGHALALLDLKPDERVLDLFCGLGNFTLPLAQAAAQVTGVEGDAGLVQRARENAALNGLDNVNFHAADLAQDFSRDAWAGDHYDAVLVDPPRSGAQFLLEKLRFPKARRLLYVSCHPGSLARDAKMLVEQHGYRLRKAGVMDMFPHTAHVESIALFERS